MNTKLGIITLSAIVVVATQALSGCAQFQDSFGELRGSELSRTDSPVAPADSVTTDHPSFDGIDPRNTENTPPARQRDFTLAGIRFGFGDGAVTQ